MLFSNDTYQFSVQVLWKRCIMQTWILQYVWKITLCVVVWLKLHQHRRLTRAQSHHGSEEERKRRKILARKASNSLPHTTIQINLVTSEYQYEQTCWLVACQFHNKTDYFKSVQLKVQLWLRLMGYFVTVFVFVRMTRCSDVITDNWVVVLERRQKLTCETCFCCFKRLKLSTWV